MGKEYAIAIEGLSFCYGEQNALKNFSCNIEKGEIFALLGPNGGGKTTLFKILSTLLPIQKGNVKILDLELTKNPKEIRKFIGVVFQNPSIDLKLTVKENMTHYGRLFNIRGKTLRKRIEQNLEHFDLKDRQRELAENLSGGLRRRLELSKTLITEPKILLLDEPSTGLDPTIRIDFSTELKRLQKENGTTIVFTTHHIEEAERCDRVGIIHQGQLIAVGRPEELKKNIAQDVVVKIETKNPKKLKEEVLKKFHLDSTVATEYLIIHTSKNDESIHKFYESFSDQIQSITISQPSLEDVFVQKTGYQFKDLEEESKE
ncbi:MAG: ABC transporter ATP-binding protein [Nitrospinota bacterium]|nr:ABC transporter ATP-binding protein [Nitrospinota bacterium]